MTSERRGPQNFSSFSFATFGKVEDGRDRERAWCLKKEIHSTRRFYRLTVEFCRFLVRSREKKKLENPHLPCSGSWGTTPLVVTVFPSSQAKDPLHQSVAPTNSVPVVRVDYSRSTPSPSFLSLNHHNQPFRHLPIRKMLDTTKANALVYSSLVAFMLVGLFAGYRVRNKVDFLSGLRTQSTFPLTLNWIASS